MEKRLTNVQFVAGQRKSEVPAFYAACDLGVITLRNTALFKDVLPSKLFEYMAMERPLVVAIDGEARRVVEAAGAGTYVPAEDPAALAVAIRELATQPDRLTEMGKSGRKWVLEHHDRAVLAREYAGYLSFAASSK